MSHYMHGYMDKTFLCFKVVFVHLFAVCHEDRWVRVVRDTAAIPHRPFMGRVDVSGRLQ